MSETDITLSSKRQDASFKTLPPARGDFSVLVREARKAAKRTGLRPSDVAKAVAKVRRST